MVHVPLLLHRQRMWVQCLLLLLLKYQAHLLLLQRVPWSDHQAEFKAPVNLSVCLAHMNALGILIGAHVKRLQRSPDFCFSLAQVRTLWRKRLEAHVHQVCLPFFIKHHIPSIKHHERTQNGHIHERVEVPLFVSLRCHQWLPLNRYQPQFDNSIWKRCPKTTSPGSPGAIGGHPTFNVGVKYGGARSGVPSNAQSQAIEQC